MAVLDAERNAVVIRIVYDGPPHAGKTTSVRALARSLTRNVETPLEAAGRTLFFDWMEYTGGLFEGHQIRCQIVSVPGQPDLAARRRALLESADVVIFVADTSDRESVERSIGHVREMVEILRRAELAIGVIVQANKRDLPGAVPRDELRAALGDDFARTALTESIAETGIGIRETFVLGVRLALDRIRELMQRGELPRGKPSIDSAEQLLSALEALPPPAPEVVGEDLESALAQVVAVRPRMPDARVASGAIWPPVEGRMVLHEATAAEMTVHRVGNGDWIAGMGSGWRVHSAAAAEFTDFDDGRQALLAWARVHAAHAELLSPSRCVVLAESSPDAWRLWQIVKLAPSLRSWLADSTDVDAHELFDRLAQAAATLHDAYLRCAETRLAPTLDTIGRAPRGAQFVALMPGQLAAPVARTTDVTGTIARDLARLLAAELVERRPELHQLVLQGRRIRTPWDEVVTAAVRG
jgi:signal recognition particle receptor subunit beta